MSQSSDQKVQDLLDWAHYNRLVPMSLLADHPNVQFNFYRPAIESCGVEMY